MALRDDECDLCHTVFLSRDAMMRHRSECMEQRRRGLTCHVCGREFASTYKLTDHQIICMAHHRNSLPLAREFAKVEAVADHHAARDDLVHLLHELEAP